MKLHRIKPALTAIAALSLIMNLSAQRHGPAAAAEQAKLLIPHPELEATLFASEPMLLNPANMDIDAEGRVNLPNRAATQLLDASAEERFLSPLSQLLEFVLRLSAHRHD